MSGHRAVPIGFFLVCLTSGVPGQTPAPSSGPPRAPELRNLTGADEARAKRLNEQIEKEMKEDRWAEAIARAEELQALRARVQGSGHFEAVDADWRVRTLRRVAAAPAGERAAFRSANDLAERARSLSQQAKYAEAQRLSEEALAIDRRLLTDDHPLTASRCDEVACNLYAQGRYAAARPLFERALEVRRRLFSDDHPDTAEGYNNLAANLQAQGRYAQARTLYERALAIRRRLLSDDHPNTADSYNNLAGNLKVQGKFAQARPLFERALEVRRRLLSDDHPDTAQSYNNLAANLEAQGRYAEAQPLHERALAIRRLLSDDHPDTAVSYNNLAYNLGAQGRYAEAQPLYERALTIRRLTLTDEHPRTADSYNNVAYNLDMQGRYAQAQPLFERALAIRRQLLTDDHPDTAVSYNNLAYNLGAQGRYAEAQPLHERALAINRRTLTDDHPRTADSYNNVAYLLNAQGRYAQAQPLFERALAIRRRLLTDDHPDTADSYHNLAANLQAQGEYAGARDHWMRAATSFETARLSAAFTGLDRAAATTRADPLVDLAAVQARLGQPAEAWRRLEEHLGRGLLDELAARQDTPLSPQERDQLRQLVAELEQLDHLFEAPMPQLDQADRGKRLEEHRRRRDRAQIALGELRSRLAATYGPRAGRVAALAEIQAALPPDAALVAWVDLQPVGPNAADPDGEHWGAVVRARGVPAWVPIAGTGPGGRWTGDDEGLADRVRAELRRQPNSGLADLGALVERFRTQRLAPLAEALAATADGLPPARRLIVLPSPALAGIPVEALLAPEDTRTVSYTPSATVLKYLRERPRPDRHAGLLALGDPNYERPDAPRGPQPLPDHGLLVNVVVPGSNAATHGLKPGDVLTAYNGRELNANDDLKVVAEGDRPIIVDVWRDGRSSRRDLAPGPLGLVLDRRPARVAIAANRTIDTVLVAARGGGEDLRPLPGTRHEVEALAGLFRSDGRPSRVLLATEASEPELDRQAAAGALGRFGFLHLATHGVIDEGVPARSAVILTQTGLPDPLQQALSHQPVYDGRLTVREIQRGWDLRAELVTLSACETARGQYAGGEGFVGFTQALLMSGARSACLSLWKVDDAATAILMQRFYANLLGVRPGLLRPLGKAEALAEAKAWLRGLGRAEAMALAANLAGDAARGKREQDRTEAAPEPGGRPPGAGEDRPYAHPYYWAAFVLVGDPD